MQTIRASTARSSKTTHLLEVVVVSLHLWFLEPNLSTQYLLMTDCKLLQAGDFPGNWQDIPRFPVLSYPAAMLCSGVYRR